MSGSALIARSAKNPSGSTSRRNARWPDSGVKSTVQRFSPTFIGSSDEGRSSPSAERIGERSFGSVPTSASSTRLPVAAAIFPSAAASVVLPTPPLPVTSTSRDESSVARLPWRPATSSASAARSSGLAGEVADWLTSFTPEGTFAVTRQY